MLDVDKQSEWENPQTGVAYTQSYANVNYLNNEKNKGRENETLRNHRTTRKHQRITRKS